MSLVSKLELERTINSMSLAAERAILKQIHKLNVSRRQVSELAVLDEQVKAKKTVVVALRENLKEQRAEISELKEELATVNTAVHLGCQVKDLMCKKIECPAERIGAVIGKKGKNVQNLKSTANVDVDIVRHNNVIHLTGTSESLDKAVDKLGKVISQIEETIELSKSMHNYLTSSKIGTLSEWRSRHPVVHFNLNRTSAAGADTPPQLRIRGTATEIAALKLDVLNFAIVEHELQVTAREAGLLVGKAGATIARLVDTHQVAIDVQRPNKGDEDKNDGAMIKTMISGPSDNVNSAVDEINALFESNREEEATVPCAPVTKSVLLLNNGTGIQELRKKVNEAAKKIDESGTGSVMISLVDLGLSVKAKAKLLEYGLQLVRSEVSRIESMLVKINVDPFVTPVIVGKGGQGIKDLKDGTKSVFLDVDREASCVALGGLDQSEVYSVAARVNALLAENCVTRLRLDSDDMGNTNSFSTISRNLLRSAAMKEARELAFILVDDDSKELVLRGKPENVATGVSLVNDFLKKNFMEELVVSTEDLSALLNGGKSSKIAEYAAATGVSLNADRDRTVVIAKGEKNKVLESMKSIREFLYGSSDVSVIRVQVASPDLLGIVIGKGGKTLADLQRKFSVSIIVHRSDAVLTLRGQAYQVEPCRVEVMKLVLSANVAKSIVLSEAQILEINKTKLIRRITQTVSVQANLSSSSVSFRGTPSDVQTAVSLFNEQLTGVYESRLQLGSTPFKNLEECCRNSVHFDRIEQQSTAKISFEPASNEIMLSGTREAVKIAKEALLTLFDSLLGPTMSRFDVSEVVIPMIGKPSVLAEVSAVTDTQLVLDRDLCAMLILASDADKVSKASEMLEAKLGEMEALVFVWKFGPTEDWLVSSVVGKNGENIKRLRKETGCTIEVDSKERRVVLYSTDADRVAGGKAVLDRFVAKSRLECAFVPISKDGLPAFLGRGGSNIKKLSQAHDVEFHIVKDPESSVRITGKEDSVASAKSAVEEWIANRAEALKDAQGEESKSLNAKHIPIVIGAKGATIRSLEREFGCRVEIDRTTSTVFVKGGSSTKRAALIQRMEEIIADDGKKAANVDSKAEQSETDSAKENLAEPEALGLEPTKVAASAQGLLGTVWTTTASTANGAMEPTPYIGDIVEDTDETTLLDKMD
jgi:rRNA processing protein Krr1/Pno1